MPGLDKTGPVGQGPMTGRRMGRCNNFGAGSGRKTLASETNEPESSYVPFYGRGYGLGKVANRYGMGCQNRFRGGKR